MNLKILERVLRYLLFIVMFPNSVSMTKALGIPSRCVPIRTPLCQGLGYFLTTIGNYFNHTSQEDAELEALQFQPLIQINCSKDFRLFLCSMYTPICIPERPYPILPCRSFCNGARKDCAPILNKYGFEWPERMNCDKLSEDSECFRKGYNYTGKPRKYNCFCRPPLIQDNRDYFTIIKTGGVDNCLMNCRSPYFPNHSKLFPTFWLGIWAGLCIISTSVCIATWYIDKSRFQYPERPIVFLSICFLCKALGYFLRVILGHDTVACNNDSIQYGSAGALSCSIVFIFIYFFDMSSAIWWVILMCSWFLAAVCNWSSANIRKFSKGYHFFAWSIPGVKTIVVLIMNYVDGDPVLGICYVGNTNKYNLLCFVIIPLILYLLSASGLLIAGLPRIISIRRTMKEKRKSQEPIIFEKLMVKIFLFGILSFVPPLIVVLCHIYEFIFRDKWEQSHTCSTSGLKKITPEYSIFMIKLFMNLAIGTCLGFWVWDRKTLTLWKMTWQRLQFRRTNNEKNVGVTNTPSDPNEKSNNDGEQFVQSEI